MSNRRKTGRERQSRRGSGSSRSGFGSMASFGAPQEFDLAGSGFNRMARSSCNECGASVEWVDEAEARRRGFDVDQGKNFIGASEVEVWFCSSSTCEQAGVFAA